MKQKDKIQKNTISLKLAKKIIFSLVFVLVFDFILFPAPAVASEYNNVQENRFSEEVLLKNNEDSKNIQSASRVEIKNTFPENTDIKISWTGNYSMTAYNSEVAQCDASPCITANGFYVCEHGIEDTVAANFLKFGTEIRIPELFGDRVLIVRDRMNARYTERVDVWLLHKDNAIDFGVKYPLIEVLK